MTNLTPWFDPKVDGQPVRVGWYQRDYPSCVCRKIPDFWNGNAWFIGEGTDLISGLLIASDQFKNWRGLTEPNEEKQ